MKRYGILISTILILGSMAKAQTNDMDSLIDYYHKYPQRAIETADSLSKAALKQKDKAQWLQAFILKNTFLLKKDEGLYPQQLSELEKLIREEKDAAARSMLHSYAGELYLQYYRGRQYQISQRTEIEQETPEDINLWTADLFINKIWEHLLASIAEKETLQSTPAEHYQKAMVTGEDSRRFRPMLYDFLCHRVIDLLPGKNTAQDTLGAEAFAEAQAFALSPVQKAQNSNGIQLGIYKDLISFHLQDATPDALLMTDLERLSFACQACSLEQKDSLYGNALQRLALKYEGNPLEVEILAEQATLLQQKASFYPVPPREEQRTLLNQALALCQKGIQKHPDYERIGLLKELVAQIKQPYLRSNLPAYLYPGETFNASIQYTNLEAFYLKIYRLPDRLFMRWGQVKDENMPKCLIKEYDFCFPKDIVRQDSALKIEGLPAGNYLIETGSPTMKEPRTNIVTCTRIYPVIDRFSNTNGIHAYDWNSGKPIAHAKILVYGEKDVFIDSLKTNEDGYALYPKRQNDLLYFQIINAENPAGVAFEGSYILHQDLNPSSLTCRLITDRTIYRPGQTVYYKGYCWLATKDTLCARTGLEEKVTFYDANGQELARQEVRTNRYGTVSGSFVIPRNALNGTFVLKYGGTRQRITVAEYKRPEFEIVLQEPAGLIFGDSTACFRGCVKSFSGAKVAYATVICNINENISYSKDLVKSDTVRTDNAGNFEMTFKAPHVYNEQKPYKITAIVTDSKGETQEGSLPFSVYSGKPTPTLNFTEHVDKTQSAAFGIALDKYAKDTEHKVHYTIAKIVAPKEVNGRIDTTVEKTITTGYLTVKGKDKGTASLDLQGEASGIYLFTAECEGGKAEKIFYLYSPEDQCPPYLTDWWLIQRKTTCAIGEEMDIIIGTSLEDAHVEARFLRPDKPLYQKDFTVSNGVIRIREPYLKAFDTRVTVRISYLKDKVFHTKDIPVNLKREYPQADIELKTFRDHLLPGSQETWEVRVTSKDKAARAEVLAMMYDASLDKIRPYDIGFLPKYAVIFYSLSQETVLHTRQGYWAWYQSKETPEKIHIPPFRFDYLNLYSYVRPAIFYTKAQATIMENERMLGDYEGVGMAEDDLNISADIQVRGKIPVPPAPEMDMPLRTDFNETAFFFPQLETDSNGCASFTFTVPDAMTQWRFVAIATTRGMAYGQTEAYATTSKPLMVRPNLPRFLRKGDHAEIKVTVSNLSDSLQAGKAVLELFDPQSKETVYSQNADFKTEAQGSITLNFALEVPEEYDVLACRITAQNGNFSDGEQHYLPILDNEVLVNTTLPITLHTAGTHTFSLKEQGKTGRPYRLTFELTANPVWYAVQALPGLTEPRHDNATEISAAYYANAIAAEITRNNPRLVDALRQWQAHPDEQQQSPLSQDPELKSILLAASPWVSEAQSETERIQQLTELLDVNRLAYLQQQALEKLADLQNDEGGWGWFKGMYPNRFITANVLCILNRAALAGQDDPEGKVKDMQAKGLRYLDQVTVKDLEEKHKNLTYNDVIYLYVRSLYRDIPLGDALAAHKQLMALAQKQWGKKSLYEKALLAVSMHHYGFEKEAKEIVESLRQYATINEQEGIFWANNRNDWFRNSAVLEHTAILEAFCLVEGESEEINAMRQWLLQQKRTQIWESVPSTVDAIHALLLDGETVLTQEELPEVRIGNQTLEPAGAQDLFGIIRASYPATEIRPNMLEVAITKKQDSPSWGGLYLQSLVPLEDIEAHGTDLIVDKKLYIEKVNPEGETVLQPVEGKVKLGDKVVVRLTVKTQRDMEFLHLQDLRAACFEPVEQLSGCRWQDGRIYYQETKDAATNLFFDFLPRGTYVFEYALRANQTGDYQDGHANLQCIYAPEFSAHSQATQIQVIP